MSLFGNLTTDGLEENEDRLGGFGRLETDVYPLTIKVAYAGQSREGAHNVTLIGTVPGGQEYRETIYVTNKKGENFFISKDDAKKKVALPGFTTIDDICQIATDKVLAEQATEEKVVNVYDFDQKKEVPKSVQVLTDLTGKTVLVAIQKTLVNKKGPSPDYEPTAETREENSIEKVFHPELRVSVVEAKQGKNAGAFIDSWIDRNRGKVRDKRTIKDGDGVQSGRPGSRAGAPTAGQGAQRKSLFGAAA